MRGRGFLVSFLPMAPILAPILAPVLALSLVLIFCGGAGATDPWADLRQRFQNPGAMRPKAAPPPTARPALEPAPIAKAAPKPAPTRAEDPWARLRAIFLPFSRQTDESALKDPGARSTVARYLTQGVVPHRLLIDEAAARFQIPRAIIAAVIMVESSGNPLARAKSSSAKGLMQTIDGTFKEACQGLKNLGIAVVPDPFNPRTSIMAGSWYLDQMFARMQSDQPGRRFDRKRVADWRRALEYYYAGPNHGRKDEEIVIVYSGGQRVTIDKPAYSRKVIHWAHVLGQTG